MKHYRYFISLLGAITLMTACDFLDVVPDDAPTIEDAFKNRAAAEKALFTCYSFLPDPTIHTIIRPILPATTSLRSAACTGLSELLRMP